MPRRGKNKQTIKSNRNKKNDKKNKKRTQKRNKKHNKNLNREMVLLDKVKDFNKQKQKTVPTLDVAIKLIKNAKKDFKKNPIVASVKLTMATAILASYAPVEQKFDIGTLGDTRSGMHAPENPTTLVKYHDKRLNPNNTAFSQRELKILSKKYPNLYESIIPHLL